MWLEELPRELSGGKDSSWIDVPPERGTVAVDAGGGHKVCIKLDAYRDEDGNVYSEVRERPARTDLALLGLLTALEGGEPDEKRLWAYYERLWEGHRWEAGTPGRVAVAPHDVPTEDEKTLLLARALLEHRDPAALAGLSDHARRERVVSVAKRIGKVTKALRELAADLETGNVRSAVENARHDVRAWELRQQGYDWSEIGRKLDIAQSKADKTKHDNQKARKAAERGGKLINKARKL